MACSYPHPRKTVLVPPRFAPPFWGAMFPLVLAENHPPVSASNRPADSEVFDTNGAVTEPPAIRRPACCIHVSSRAMTIAA